ncbi:hypothetical protein FOMPIDRAFT_91683 [Fomitopsis schrenkii]|uniref:Uncharacterized protein n=1 Tax=Fomitopsis schrenkii TaxID=2126942 RepID=S8FK04_FOMSC|nr:hypothetical protein FOMPIDRAFT_91683 [Fomitopsis schrenkii]
MSLCVEPNQMDSWQGLVTGLHELVSRLCSPEIRSLSVKIFIRAPGDHSRILAHPDSEFWTINLISLHDLMKRPLFDSLQDASIHIHPTAAPGRLTCDAVFMAEDMKRRLCLILEPWDKRGILTVGGYDEPTEEELRQQKSIHASESAEEGRSGGPGGEEAQSLQDETVLALDQEPEVEGGLESAA